MLGKWVHLFVPNKYYILSTSETLKKTNWRLVSIGGGVKDATYIYL